ncbi:hypothetical protein O1L60_21720 [Streptomyces diastatochromogenes]|nr:hypothetical protein [Streptomyces diastatochromogenes]
MPLTRRNVLTAMAAAPVLAPALAPAGAAQAAVPQTALPTAEPAVWPAAVTLPEGHRFDLKSQPADLLGRRSSSNTPGCTSRSPSTR